MLNRCCLLIKAVPVHAIAHITGGGLPGNLPCIARRGADAVIDEILAMANTFSNGLQQQGNVERFEMYRTFNCSWCGHGCGCAC